MNRLGWALAGALAITVVAVLARASQAGPLDPPGPVASTMKTIGDLVPAWHQTLTSNGCGSSRWSCVMGNAAVLDNETGLVWETTPLAGSSDWVSATQACDQSQTGGRMGWRLPTAEELLTLHDPSSYQLPSNSPFIGVNGSNFWSSTSAPNDESSARFVGFNFNSASAVSNKQDNNVAGAWCVRGQHGQDFATQADDSWSKTLYANLGNDPCTSERFQCVLGNQSVLDHQTALVWTKIAADAPDDLASNGPSDCYHAVIGGVSAWRLPTELELLTLLDTSNVNPAFSVPSGNPFTALATFALPWLSSTNNGGVQWGVAFKGGSVGQPGAPFSTSSSIQLWNIWCVRAPDK